MNTVTTPKQSPDFLAGQQFERDRITTILSHKMATLNIDFACVVIKQGFDAPMARQLLDAAYLDLQRTQPNTQANQFVNAMKSLGNPAIMGGPEPERASESEQINQQFYAGSKRHDNNPEQGFL
ncbi:MAG: hypothetical protein K9J77_06015 [Rhodoferax sp.]|nr:hypothetical protein [Rhodoferax sp.]